MKILLVSPTSVTGGAERAFTSLARRLPEHGVVPHAVLLGSGPLENWLAEAGCSVTVLGVGRTRQLATTARVICRLAERAAEADLVISNQSKGHVYGGLAAKMTGRPSIWWQHGIPSRSRIELAAAAVPASVVVCGGRDALAAQRRLTPWRRTRLIHPGIDLDGVAARIGSGAAVRHEMGWGTKQVVGIVGRLQPWKGQDVFLRAMVTVGDTHPQAHFVVVGGAILGWEGDYPERLRALAVELGIADRVDFVGHQDDVYPWLDAIDVVVHASLGEPFGLVVVEAMALGKPVVATAAGGPVEIIEDGVSGILTRPGDVAALAGAVEGLLGAPTTALALGARARERAREFSDQRTAEQFVSLIRQVRQTSGVASRGDQVGLIERTVEGLHDYLEHCVLPRSRRPGQRAIDLGAGSGALAIRLERLGYDVLAVDTDRPSFEAQVVFCAVDLNESGFADALGREGFALVTAVEVIEHLQSPIAFLQGVRALLADDGIAVVTTPNLDSLPARVKFLVKGKVRMFDERGDPTHITPILWDLLVRQYLPCSGLRIVEQHLYPPDGFLSGRPAYRRALNLVGPWLTRCGPRLVGDNHVLVLSRADSTR